MSSDPSFFSLLWVVPFGGILLSLALMPLIAPRFWHHHFGFVLVGWMGSFIAAFIYSEGLTTSLPVIMAALIHHFIPFVALITVLYTTGGGIYIKMKGKASPLMNTGFLGAGALLANLIGTTGASMLFIRPLISINKYRRYTTHVIIFFIFLVSNIGGILTPLGDPPLFIGFLNGVDFFWTSTHLFYPLLVVGGVVLGIFWLLDHYYFYHDPAVPDPEHMQGTARIEIKGKRNLIFLGAAIAAIVIESKYLPKFHLSLGGLSVEGTGLGRDLFLFAMAYGSWKLTPVSIYEINHFTWAPLKEVMIVFCGIFITVIPVLGLLKAGESGPLAAFFYLANPEGLSQGQFYFWMTGLLSSVLDNAPTYLIFFNMAGGKVDYLMKQGAPILEAISMGAVFMGALTYIGNAPNFMIRSIAVQSHIKMPGFLGYLAWSVCILVPVFLGFSLFWFS